MVLRYSGMTVIFSTTPAVLAFVCASATGLIFGYLPARKAARLIRSWLWLRSEVIMRKYLLSGMCLSHWDCRPAASRRNSNGRQWRCPAAGATFPESVSNQTKHPAVLAGTRKRRVESRHRSGAGAESRPRSGFVSNRAGPRPGKSRGISAVSSVDASAGASRNYLESSNSTAARGPATEVDLWGKTAISWPLRTTARTRPSMIEMLCSSSWSPIPPPSIHRFSALMSAFASPKTT